MLQTDSYAVNSANFNFSFTTSDGDKIEFKMYDSLQTSSSYKKGGGYISQELTLKHQYGYEYSYEGNGLSKEDLKEIKEAFEKVKPLFEKFLKQKNTNEKMLSNVTQYMKSYLPEPKDENHLNAIKQEGVNTFDDVLKSIKATLDDLEKTKKLFDKLFDNSTKFELFA